MNTLNTNKTIAAKIFFTQKKIKKISIRQKNISRFNDRLKDEFANKLLIRVDKTYNLKQVRKLSNGLLKQ